MSQRSLLAGTVAVLLVATALRLAAFGQVPPGLYHDEAYHGLDALDVLQGRYPVYFAANNGREPLFIYLVSLSIGLLGQSPFALRLVAAFVGLLTVAATAAMGRVLFSRRVGLLAAAVLAVTLWHVHLSRVGYRAVLLPLFTALAVWQGALGTRTRRWGHWLAAGVLYALSFYTYVAARFTLVAVAGFVLYALATQPRARNAWPWRGLGLALVAALLTVAPLGIYALRDPEVVLGRPGQVSVFSPAIHGGDPWGTLAVHALRTLGMFFVRGDRIWRHNVPWRPVFDPALGAAFVLGLLVAARRAHRDLAAGLVLFWTAVMTLPTLLAEDAPHFLRGVGVLPMVVLLPALGLDWLLGAGAAMGSRLPAWMQRRILPRAAGTERRAGTEACPGRWLVVAAVLVFGLASAVYAYFWDYAREPMTGYWFEGGAVELAGRLNKFLGVGWDGQRMVRGGAGERRAYVDPVLWQQWPQVRFLVAARQAVVVGLDQGESSGPVAAFLWPYGEWQRAWAVLPHPAEITVEEGPLSQGDRDPEPFVTYLAFFATPRDTRDPPLARFSGGVELLGVQAAPAGEERLVVQLRWRATAALEGDYTVFMHYLRDGELVAQGDARPANGRYPTTVWRPGDVINDGHDVVGVGAPLVGRDALLFGFWQPESGAVLHLLDEVGNPAADWIVVPLGTQPGT